MSRARVKRAAQVIPLSEARVRRSVANSEAKILRMLESNRRALTELFATETLFTPQGSDVGRDLLLTHQHLLRVLELLRDLQSGSRRRRASSSSRDLKLYDELSGLLERTEKLTDRTGTYLTQMHRD